MKLTTEYSGVKELVERVSGLLLELAPKGGDTSHLAPQIKDDGSPVSRADYEANELLLDGLSKLFPSDELHSEESPLDRFAGQVAHRWIIDPLDGTRSFLADKDDYSILLCRTLGGEPCFSMMAFPARGVLAWAQVGQGAYINGARLKVSDNQSLRTGGVYVRNTQLSRGREHEHPESMDSGLAQLKVADGTFDGAVIRIVTHREWDIAAPSLVVKEAGGIVSDQAGAPLSFQEPGLKVTTYIAASQASYPAVLAAMK